MRPLTLDDVLPLEEFTARRAELFREHVRYVDRCRRVRIGPELTLVFENRRTLWFKVQELLRVARLEDPVWIERELAWYNRLLPGPDRLQAALLIALPEGEAGIERSRFWSGFGGAALRLQIDQSEVPGRVITQRPGEKAAGTAHWVEFDLDNETRAILADYDCHLRLVVDFGNYHHQSAELGVEVRESLIDDLTTTAACSLATAR